MHQENQKDKAITYLENAIKVYPQSIKTSIQLAEIYALDGNIDGAERVLQNTLKTPLDLADRAIVYSRIGEILIYFGRFVKGLAYLENALDLSFESKNYFNIYMLLDQTCEILLEFNQPLLVENKRQQIKKRLEQANYNNESLSNLIELTIPLKLALSKNDWQNAESLLSSFEKNTGQENIFLFNSLNFLLEKNHAKDIQYSETKIKSAAQSYEKMPVDLQYNIAYYLTNQARNEQAAVILEEILKTKELFVNGMPLYYNKALALLSEIYEMSGDYKYSEELCNKLLKNWEKADPELEIFDEIQARQRRLKISIISSDKL